MKQTQIQIQHRVSVEYTWKQFIETSAATRHIHREKKINSQKGNNSDKATLFKVTRETKQQQTHT